MRPVSELVASAEKLSEDAEGDILQTTDGAEFAALANSLNQLIGRVRRAASLQEQFASDAAHELRTPLALLQTRIEVNLQKERTPEEHVVAQTAMLRQIDRLAMIVSSLLATARQQSGTTQIVDFGTAVRDAITDWCDLTGWPASRLEVEIAQCASTLSHEEIGIILRNVLDNSASHSPEDASIQVLVTCSDERIQLTIRDYGSGLTEDMRTLAFDRFYRADEGRGRQDGGAGIGLAVVKRIAESHQGTVVFMPVEVGAMFVLQVPLVSS